MDYRCLQCHAKNFGSLIRKSNIPNGDKHNRMQWFYKHLANLSPETPSPNVSTEIYRYFRRENLNGDPYADEKKKYNQLLLNQYDSLKTQITNAESIFDKALQFAIAGNIIDFGPNHQIPLAETLQKVEKTAFAIDHSHQLKSDLSEAKKILWLGDNAGEIVLDKLFIDTMGLKNVQFAVRGTPVINDVTMEDADFVGMHHVACVLSNGYDAPSTILDESSEAFQQAFYEADVIISKGQGNYEGLMNHTQQKIYFLLMAKCHVIAEKLNVHKGDFVVLCNHLQDE